MDKLPSSELADSLSVVVWVSDADGRLRWINKHWTTLTGMSHEEALATNAMPPVHPDDVAQVIASWEEGFAASKPYDVEYRLRTRDGEYRWHMARIEPRFDKDGKVSDWVGSALDIQSRHDAEDARRKVEQRFEAAFDVSPQQVAIMRLRDGTVRRANAAFCAFAGLPIHEVVGRTMVELGLFSEEERAHVREYLLRTNPARMELTLRRGDGRRVDVVLATSHIEFEGEPCLLGAAHDVSELRASEERERARADELEALMDAVPAAVWITHDPDGKEIRSNRAGSELLQIPPGANMSRSTQRETTRHFRVMSDGVELTSDQLPMQRAARGDEVRRFEEELQFDDGSVVHLFGSAVPLRDGDGEPRGAIGAFVDVTAMKVAQAAMRAADRRKDEFLAMLSHELRNPLAPIITAAQLMELRGDESSALERGVILRQARHLMRLVDDLLDVSRIASGKVRLDRRYMDLGTSIANAVEVTRPLFEEQRHQLVLEVAGDLAISGDETRLTQVISNLMANAARYTPPHGRIVLKAGRDGGSVSLSVRDNGTGIEASLRDKIFEMFVQGERGVDRALGGLGLGLFLVRLLTELHGGSVKVHSEGPGRGSEFTVQLPAAGERPMRERPSQRNLRTKVNERTERILVVDDNQDGARTIARLLERSGHQVRVAFDPSEAVSIAVAFEPQVAIVDIGLPVMDGYALAAELRARLPVAPAMIALTGYGQDQDVRRSEQAGFAAHLVKPVYLEVLVEVLAKL